MFNTKSLLTFTNNSLNEYKYSTTLNEWINNKIQIQDNFAWQRINNKHLNESSSDFCKVLLQSNFIVFLFWYSLPFIDFSERSITGLVLIPWNNRCLTMGDEAMWHSLVREDKRRSTYSCMCPLYSMKAAHEKYSVQTFYSLPFCHFLKFKCWQFK